MRRSGSCLSSPAGVRGLSMVEVMVTVGIIAVVSAIAVPSFTNIIHSSRLSDVGNSFVSSAQLARGEAIKTNATVSMCASSNGTSCNATTVGAWRTGWIVFRDPDSDGVVDAGETVIQVQQTIASDYRLTASATGHLLFQPSGVGSTAVTMTLCKATPSVNTNQRTITLSVTGRATVANSSSATCS